MLLRCRLRLDEIETVDAVNGYSAIVPVDACRERTKPFGLTGAYGDALVKVADQHMLDGSFSGTVTDALPHESLGNSLVHSRSIAWRFTAPAHLADNEFRDADSGGWTGRRLSDVECS